MTCCRVLFWVARSVVVCGRRLRVGVLMLERRGLIQRNFLAAYCSTVHTDVEADSGALD